MIICHSDRSAPIQTAKVTERRLGHLYTSQRMNRKSVLLICLHFTVFSLHRKNRDLVI